MGKTVKKIAKFALPIAGSFIPGVGPIVGAAIGGAASGALEGDGLKGILKGAGTAAAGNIIGGSIADTLGKGFGSFGSKTIGSVTSKNAMGPFSFGDLGSTAANTIGNSLANTTLSQGLGSFAGNAAAGSIADSLFGAQGQIRVNPSELPGVNEPSPFEAKQESQLQLPNSLSGLSPEQQSSSIATQGVYGGGASKEDEDFFTNMINRRLVDESGKVDQDLSEISPIESSYLSQLGLGGYDNPSSLLEALYGRKKQAAYA